MPSLPPPLRPTAAPPPRDLLPLLAVGSLVLCALMVAMFLLQAALAWPMYNTLPWQWLLALAQDYRWPRSLVWMLQHPVATSLWMAAACVPSLVASWGLYRRRRWGLWSFVVMLVASGLANVGIALWMDAVLVDLIARIDDPGFQFEMRTQRVLLALTAIGGAVVLLALQGWLAWRLLQPDMRARFTQP